MRAADRSGATSYLGVMVSSTVRYVEEHRAALIKLIEGHGLHAIAMEQDAALPSGTVVDESLRKVRAASAYVGVVSHLYGQIPQCPENPEGLSLTELEFREARRLGRPILILIMGPEHPLVPAAVERDPEKIVKLDRFREDVKRRTIGSGLHRVYYEFNDIADFSVAASQSLADLRRYLDTAVVPVVQGFAADDRGRHGIPSPPDLYAEPRYIGSHAFVGRLDELARLSTWSAGADPHPVLLFEAIGGTGKSMLTWEWVTRHAAGAQNWAGRCWYSFYEKGSEMADFCARTLAYMTGRPLASYRRMRPATMTNLLVSELNTRPWLLVLDGLERVLVAYNRYDAAQLADEQADDASDGIAHRDPCSAIRPQDEDLLRLLATATPSKVLITSRLVPSALMNSAKLPIPGVVRERLSGLRPADAEALLRASGIRGESQTIQNYLQRHCDCHPLVTGIVAGLVNSYLPARGRFDVWARDPEFGGRFELAELNLIQKRNHILHAALAALSDPSAQLLSTLALLSEAVDYGTLSAFNPHSPSNSDTSGAGDSRRSSADSAEARRGLTNTVLDLERRGLLQYDWQSGRYDLHPVVRGVASGSLAALDRERLGQRVVDHFSARAHHPYIDAESLDDLQIGLTVVRTLLRMGRLKAAHNVYRNDLARPLLVNLEAYGEVLSLLRPFFGHRWTVPAPDIGFGARGSYLATEVATALRGLGEVDLALLVDVAVLDASLERESWSHVRACLSNLAISLFDQNRVAQSGRCRALALDLADLIGEDEDRFMARLRLFRFFADTGRVADAEQMWGLLDPPYGSTAGLQRFSLGDAELLRAYFDYQQDRLTERQLTRAEGAARTNRNRNAVRQLCALRGEWSFRQARWSDAAGSLHEAVRMARETGVVHSTAETLLALARLRLGQLAAPHQEAERLARLRRPAYLPLAELWQLLGDVERARACARAAHSHAAADGEPYVQRFLLRRAADLLEELGADVPEVSVHDPVADPPPDWELRVVARVAKLRTGRAWSRRDSGTPRTWYERT